MNYDSSLYSKSVELDSYAREIRKSFMKQFVSRITWDVNDVVMDIGCGPGDVTLNILYATIPDVKAIIGVDVLPYMIDFAKLHNTHSKVQYHVADVSNKKTIEKWIGEISKIFSMYCLQSMNDQEAAFKNMFRLLSANGEAILLFALSSSLFLCYDRILASPKWQKFLEGVYIDIPESHKMNYTGQHYKNLLEENGFIVLACEEKLEEYVYDDDVAAKESVASYCSCTFHIPEELKEDFKNDLFESYMEHNGRDADGRPQASYRMLSLHLKKP